MGEIFASYTSDKRLIARINRKLKNSNPVKNQQPNEEMSKQT
jgi:hypothetical protein